MCGHRLPPGGIFPLHGLVQSPASSGYEEKSAGISRSSAWFKTGSSLASRLLGDHGWVAQEPCGGLRPSPLSSHLSTHREQFLPPNPTHQPRTSRTDMQYSGGLGYQPSGSLLGPRLNEKRPPRVTGRTLACHELGLYSVGGGQRKGGGVTLGPCPRVWVFFFLGGSGGGESMRSHPSQLGPSPAGEQLSPPGLPTTCEQESSLGLLYIDHPTLRTGSAHAGASKNEQENCSLNDFSSHVYFFEGGDGRSGSSRK